MATKQPRGVTRAGIMDAGMELFLSQGAAVTVKDVAEAANVSRQLVYQYFNSRSGLLTALTRLVDVRSGGKELFYRSMQVPEPQERLLSCIEVWLSYMKDIQILANELNRSRRTDPDAELAYKDRVDDAKTWFKDLHTTLKKDGALRDQLSVADASALSFSVLSPQIYELLRVDEKWSHQKIVSQLSEILIRTILKAESVE